MNASRAVVLLYSLYVSMFALAATAGAAEPAAQPPPKPAVKLNNDAVYAAKLESVLKTAPGNNATPEEQFRFLLAAWTAESNMRHYDKAEAYARQLVKLRPDDPLAYSSLSVFLGKQGKLKEAEEACRTALRLDPNWMHAKLVLASWVWLQGRKEEALKLAGSVAEPDDKAWKGLYFGCLACFYASVGDENKIQAYIKQTRELDPQNMSFFERDIVFDPYRGKDWFIKLVGKTLAEPDGATGGK
ncbi:MAG: tetratricopeptide repeat protein [Planctomycetota bacterium]|nr:tetratricopeptide repeat protein [Planctomycetota bacterium]